MHIKEMIPWAGKEQSPETKVGEQNPIAILQRDMNLVFDRFWNRFAQTFGAMDRPESGIEVKSDVVETAKAVEVSLELPGLDMKDIEVAVTDTLLTVKGEKKVERQEEKGGYYLSERTYGSVYRTIPLPPGVDGANAEASFKNGVLTIRLPQAPDAQAKVKRIEVKNA